MHSQSQYLSGVVIVKRTFDINDEECLEYAEKVMEYKRRFAHLDDSEYKLGVGFDDMFNWNDYTIVPHPVKRDFTLEYDLGQTIDTILKNVRDQLISVERDIRAEKRKYYPPTCSDYIRNSADRIINPSDLFERWEKYIDIYTKYKEFGSKIELKAGMDWFETNYKFRNPTDVMAYVTFIKELVVAANKTDGSFFKQAEKIFTEGKTRTEKVRKRTPKK